MSETIFLGSDHAGFEMKEAIKSFLIDEGYAVQDMGAKELDEGDDYPDFIAPVAHKVSMDPVKSKGIVFGGSGQGEAMCANTFFNVRAAVYYGGDERILTLSREHNDANVLSLGARFLSTDEAKKAVKTWLTTGFSGDERHIRRITKIRGKHEENE